MPDRDDTPVLVTGAAGFIGARAAELLLAGGRDVVGLDDLNPYYDVRLKHARLDRVREGAGRAGGTFEFVECGVEDRPRMAELFRSRGFGAVVHLAAQAGVRHSLKDPHAYVDSNVVGFMNVLEGCRHHGVGHLVYASSSSVYGGNTTIPFSEHGPADHPLSIYAATKRANELMAHSYSHLFGLPATGLRFFTVYGPWGRPDMAMFLFTERILAGKPIDVFNHGDMRRDFTYIDDVAESVVRVVDHLPTPGEPDAVEADPSLGTGPSRVYNIGNHTPVELTRLIEVLEEALGRPAERNLLPMQPGDVPATYAEVADLSAAVGFAPDTPIEEGVGRFVAWYRGYYGV
ncbi:MAG: NAD-dependent epimerase [Planctomycetota bacterium]